LSQTKGLESFELGQDFSLTFEEEETVNLGAKLCPFSFACYANVKELHTFTCSSNMLPSVRKSKKLLFQTSKDNFSEHKFFTLTGWSPVYTALHLKLHSVKLFNFLHYMAG
jgi:hypothetical protein